MRKGVFLVLMPMLLVGLVRAGRTEGQGPMGISIARLRSNTVLGSMRFTKRDTLHSAAYQEKSAGQPAETASPSAKWEKEIQAYEEADKKAAPPQGGILFIGSSSTRFWTTLAKDFPDHAVINRGFGGSQVADSVYFADRIVIPYRPKLIVLQVGGNDIAAGKTPEQVLTDVKAFVAKVRAKLPETRIAYLSINPSPIRWEKNSEKEKQANRLIAEYMRSGKNLDYIDLWDQFLGPDGKPREELFRSDRLHNNAAGYKIRAEVVRPHLQQTKSLP